MRISFERSGGRGEYEFRTDDGPVHASEIQERELILSLPQGWLLKTGLKIRLDNGKWRLRNIQKDKRMLIQRQLAAALMLPKPKRSFESLNETLMIIQRDQYVLDDIMVNQVSESEDNAVVLETETMYAKNG